MRLIASRQEPHDRHDSARGQGQSHHCENGSSKDCHKREFVQHDADVPTMWPTKQSVSHPHQRTSASDDWEDKGVNKSKYRHQASLDCLRRELRKPQLLAKVRNRYGHALLTPGGICGPPKRAPRQVPGNERNPPDSLARGVSRCRRSSPQLAQSSRRSSRA